jgi:hypothetical protein
MQGGLHLFEMALPHLICHFGKSRLALKQNVHGPRVCSGKERLNGKLRSGIEGTTGKFYEDLDAK